MKVGLLNFIQTVVDARKRPESKTIAKERLKQVILRDRVDISPQFMRAVRYDMVTAVSQYMDISESEVQIQLYAGEYKVSLVADIPVLKINAQAKLKIDGKKKDGLV
jgi:cell division topological specificity factor